MTALWNFYWNRTERTFYWHFVVSLRNLRLAFLPKCIISAKYFLPYQKSNFEVLIKILRDQKYVNFLFFIFSLWRLSNSFFQRSYQKTTSFHNNVKSAHIFLHFHKDLTSKNFWQWNDGPLKILWKLHENAFYLLISAKLRKFETCIYIEICNFG